MMKTVILKEFQIDLAINALKKGSVVVFPTETVYGLGADAFNESAIQKIFTIKNRPMDNPLIAHISEIRHAEMLSNELGDDFFRLSQAFWPGPLSMVVKKRKEIPAMTTANLDTIALRMPDHPIAIKLISGLNSPIVAPSANLSGRPSGTNLKDILEDLENRVEYIIESNESKIGIESSVISLVHKTPLLLRPGFIKKEEIEEILQKKIDIADEKSPVISPGMKYRHYAPKAKVKLYFKTSDLPEDFFIPTKQNLYKMLRELDRKNISEIACLCDENVQKDEALMNRLLRSAGRI